jgi:hypothetical protein
MATVEKGALTKALEWWDYLRWRAKRRFWNSERRAAQLVGGSPRRRRSAEGVGKVDGLAWPSAVK